MKDRSIAVLEDLRRRVGVGEGDGMGVNFGFGVTASKLQAISWSLHATQLNVYAGVQMLNFRCYWLAESVTLSGLQLNSFQAYCCRSAGGLNECKQDWVSSKGVRGGMEISCFLEEWR